MYLTVSEWCVLYPTIRTLPVQKRLYLHKTTFSAATTMLSLFSVCKWARLVTRWNPYPVNHAARANSGAAFVFAVIKVGLFATIRLTPLPYNVHRSQVRPIKDTPRSSPTISPFGLLSRSCRCTYGGPGRI